jgi:hypothetical protein
MDTEYSCFQAVGNHSFSLGGYSVYGIMISVSYYSYYEGQWEKRFILWTNEGIYYLLD